MTSSKPNSSISRSVVRMSSAPVGMEVDGPLSLQHFDERFEIEIDVGRRRIVFRIGGELLPIAIPLVHVFAGFDELAPLQRGDFHPRDRRRFLFGTRPLRVFAVRHLETAEHAHRFDFHLLDGVAAKFDVDRLPADRVAAAWHDVRGGDAAGGRHANRRLHRIDGVHRTNPALHRPASLVAVAARAQAARTAEETKVRVRIDEPWDDRHSFGVDLSRIAWNLHLGRFADRNDLRSFDDQRAVVDRRTCRRQDSGVHISDRLVGSDNSGRGRQMKHGGDQEQHGNLQQTVGCERRTLERLLAIYFSTFSAAFTTTFFGGRHISSLQAMKSAVTVASKTPSADSLALIFLREDDFAFIVVRLVFRFFVAHGAGIFHALSGDSLSATASLSVVFLESPVGLSTA